MATGRSDGSDGREVKPIRRDRIVWSCTREPTYWGNGVPVRITWPPSESIKSWNP